MNGLCSHSLVWCALCFKTVNFPPVEIFTFFHILTFQLFWSILGELSFFAERKFKQNFFTQLFSSILSNFQMSLIPTWEKKLHIKNGKETQKMKVNKRICIFLFLLVHLQMFQVILIGFRCVSCHSEQLNLCISAGSYSIDSPVLKVLFDPDRSLNFAGISGCFKSIWAFFKWHI